jgi:hypothetical protein
MIAIGHEVDCPIKQKSNVPLLEALAFSEVSFADVVVAVGNPLLFGSH